jgi:hypothetical protein
VKTTGIVNLGVQIFRGPAAEAFSNMRLGNMAGSAVNILPIPLIFF